MAPNFIPIPIIFDDINRSAISVKPKKPFVDWINEYDKSMVIKAEEIGANIYLLPDFLDEGDFDKYLKRYFKEIFENQLNEWWTDETLWPKNRTFKLFKEWFEIKAFDMVWDVLNKPVLKI